MKHTAKPEKNPSKSFSVVSKVKLPTKAVKGGAVGMGTSARAGLSD